jgi:hypothetical protein
LQRGQKTIPSFEKLVARTLRLRWFAAVYEKRGRLDIVLVENGSETLHGCSVSFSPYFSEKTV